MINITPSLPSLGRACMSCSQETRCQAQGSRITGITWTPSISRRRNTGWDFFTQYEPRVQEVFGYQQQGDTAFGDGLLNFRWPCLSAANLPVFPNRQQVFKDQYAQMGLDTVLPCLVLMAVTDESLARHDGQCTLVCVLQRFQHHTLLDKT